MIENQQIRPVIIGSFGPPVLACIRSWGKFGLPVGFICIGKGNEYPPESKFLSSWIKISPDVLFSDQGIEKIASFLDRFRATGLMCIMEQIALKLQEKKESLPGSTMLWLPPAEVIKNVLSKKKQIQVAEEVGMDLLPTFHVGEDYLPFSIAEEYFPLCLRPSLPGDATPPFKVRIANTEKELTRFVSSLERITNPVIAQPFKNLPNLVVHGARSVSGKHIGLEAFIVERKFEGVTLTIRKTELIDSLKNKCTAFTDRFRLTGPYHFEFLFDQETGKAFFLEINNRFGGTTAKVYSCGYDEPMLALCAYDAVDKVNYFTDSVTASSKTALVKYMFKSLSGELTSLDYPMESNTKRFFAAARAMLFSRDDVFDFHDISGSSALYTGNFLNKIRKVH